MDHGEPQLASERTQLEAEPVAQRLVERRQRFVEQQHTRTRHEGAREGDPLSLAARQRRGVAIFVARQPDEFERLGDTTAPLRARDAGATQRILDVAARVPVRPHGVLLEDHAQTPRLRWVDARPLGDDAIADEHAAAGRRHEPRDAAQQGRLSGSGGTDERKELTVRNGEVHGVEADGAAAEPDEDVLEGDG